MSKEYLFELIRQDNVVLWAGAGLSKYAGYPTGTELKKILFDNLKDPKQSEVTEHADLDKVAQALEDQTMSRNGLTRILKNVFEAKPKKYTTHKIIYKIPHFRTIITTNYDQLFEKIYGNNIQVSIDNIDILYRDKTKTELFKIHGCISRPDSIIITKNDYLKFIKNYTDETNYWTVIKERIITRPILFMGYGLNDDNINITLDRISELIGTHKRECFLVAPKITERMKVELIQKNIKYIDLSADKFFNELIENIKKNINTDFLKRKVSREICEKFVNNYNIAITSYISDNKSVTQHFEPINSNPIYNVKFDTDETTKKTIDEYFKSNNLNNLQLLGTNIGNFEVSLNGITILNKLKSFIVSPSPKDNFYGDIRFKNGKEIENVNFIIFKSNQNIAIKLIKLNLKIELHASINEFSIENNITPFETKIDHGDYCGSVKEEIDIHLLLVNFGSQESFKILRKGEIIFEGQMTTEHPDLNNWKAILSHFESLKKIEKRYDISFYGLKYIISETDVNYVDLIQKAMVGEPYESNFEKGISMRLKEKTKEYIELLENIKSSQLVYIHYPNEIILYLHEKPINLGFLTCIIDHPYFDTNNIYSEEIGIYYCMLYSRLKTRKSIFSASYNGPHIEDNRNIHISLKSESN